jgi:hypothetical protein
MARCEVCCWGEVDHRDIDGGEVCAACEKAMAIAQSEGEDTE